MGIIGRQFGSPVGLIGGLAGRFMARNNADLNRWIVTELVGVVPRPTRIVEVGSGPGVGTEALLAAFPDAEVIAVDPSPAMQRQLRRRNRAAVEHARLQTVTGRLRDVTRAGQVDVILAVHVLYFWTDPIEELRQARSLLRPGGLVALGYQLGHDMPAIAQRDFPASGHRLVADDSEVRAMLVAAGLECLPVRVKGSDAHPAGRLAIGRSAPD